ncbi:MAG: T9SS type A sorting domain-containing protein [Cytophagales bacterium]|jgi:hypothetical protein|nr:T9SS type A sorting domain-containing protein [Cytophagales bacterium]MCA6373348.1 T9SS type A sorting domain-containing protein [Cytophagales bacterium]MCA6377218.1 T9SS type A sorting domain-containing protein [Cytophagales bacterium]MCA6384433.1 T9SS type A sorting domain-containing protein [Cytophagales bacterium]
MKGILVLFFTLSLHVTFAQATRTSVASPPRNWDQTNAWVGGIVPSGTDNVVIAGTITVRALFPPPSFTGTVTVNAFRTLQNNGVLTGGAYIVNGTLNNTNTVSPSSITVGNTGVFTSFGGVTNVSGNVTVNTGGTFTYSGSGLLTFNGSSSTLSGALNVFDLEVGGGTNVTLAASAAVNVNGLLRLYSGSGGSFDADGPGSGVTTIRSTSSTTGGGIQTLPDPTKFTGNVTIERYIDGDESWRYLSMPIASGNVGDWKNGGLSVSGNFTDPSPQDGTIIVDNTAASIYEYDAVTTGDFVAIGNGGSVASTGLDFRKGYAVYAYDGAGGDFVVSVSGNINKGPISIPLGSTPSVSDTRKWNLIANPYPSTIDSDNIDFTAIGSAAIYVRQSNPPPYTSGGTVASYSQGGPLTCTGCGFDTGWTGEIAIGQSFWIENVNSAASLALDENVKTTNGFTFLRKETPTNLFRVTLVSSSQKDDLIIAFKEQASANFDKRDATKRKNGDPTGLGYNTYINLSSITEDGTRNLAINTMPHLTKSTVVKLSMEDVVPGNHTLEFTQLETLSLGYKIVLIDKFASKEVEVVNGLKYNFAVSSDAKTFGNDRFSLRIDVSNLTTAIEDEANELVQVYPNPVADKLIVELDQKSKNAIKQIDLVDSRGSLLESILPEAFSDKISIDLSSRCTGIYIVKVFRSNGASVHKIVKR